MIRCIDARSTVAVWTGATVSAAGGSGWEQAAASSRKQTPTVILMFGSSG